MLGTAVSVLVPAASGDGTRQGFRAAWAMGVLEPSGAVMIPVVCADGETRSYASHIFPLRDPHGELVAVCAAWSPPHDRDAPFGRSTEKASRHADAHLLGWRPRPWHAWSSSGRR